jgi:hypothetical protein
VYIQENANCFEDKLNIFYIGNFRKNGISIYMYKPESKSNEFQPYIIKVKINFRYIYGPGDATEIFEYSRENLQAAVEHANMLMCSLDKELAFNSMTLRRVDLCVNVEFENKGMDEVGNFLRLIGKMKIPKNYIQRMFDDKDSNKRSFCIENGSVGFKAYDKIYEVIDNGHERYCDDFNPDRQLLRFEITLKQRKIAEIAKQKNLSCETDVLLDYLCSNSKLIMKEYIFKFFPSGSYCHYSTAMDIIEICGKSKKLRDRMWYLLTKTSECKNINNAMELTAEEYALTDKQQEKLLSAFEEIGINPVTLKNKDICLACCGIRALLELDNEPKISKLLIERIDAISKRISKKW